MANKPDAGAMVAAVGSVVAALIVALEHVGALTEEWSDGILAHARDLIGVSSQDADVVEQRRAALRIVEGMLASVRASEASPSVKPN